MDQQKFSMASPVKSPFKDECRDNLCNSPLNMESTFFSPFKNSSLSPFKLMNQSPSKGSFNDWDKDFIASFEEKLFGIVDISENCDELMKSPLGKALLESRSSPNKANSAMVRQLKISPENRQRNTSQNFQALHDQSSDVFSLPVHTKTVPVDAGMVNKVKEQSMKYDHLYGRQHNLVFVNNTLSLVDPDNMNATPIKKNFINVDTAPVRRLAMKVMEGQSNVLSRGFTKQNIQRNNVLYDKSQQQDQPLLLVEWPDKDKLKYARLKFQEILNKAVEKEREIRKEIIRKKEREIRKEIIRKKDLKDNKHNKYKCTDSKCVPSKHIYVKVTKQNQKKKKRKRKNEIQQAKVGLSKPVKGPGCISRVQKLQESVLGGVQTSDHDWYSSGDGDCSYKHDISSGSQSIYSQGSSSVYSGDECSGEDNEPCPYQFETISKRKLRTKWRNLTDLNM